jgi:lysozyme
MSDPTVVDLSSYQANVDFEALKASGVLAVILKCTEGTTIMDKTFPEKRQAAADAGMPCASYHYLHHGNVAEQMAWYINCLSPQSGERLCIDYEASDCTIDDLHEAVAALMFFNYLNGADLQITVYSGHLLKDQLGTTHDPLLAENTSLWLAQYTTGSPSWPSGTYPTWSLWQYTDNAEVGGYDGPVDGNRFNGPDEHLLAWIGPASEPLPPPPDDVVPEVTLTVSSSLPVDLSLVIDENVTIV